jgi:hypothetical protein
LTAASIERSLMGDVRPAVTALPQATRRGAIAGLV